MESLKKKAIDMLSKMPETATLEDIVYQLYVIEKVRRAQTAVQEGDVLTEQEVRQEMKLW
jgi:hypothetical protein